MDITIRQSWPPGDEPTEIEVVAQSTFGEVTSPDVVAFGEPAHLDEDSPDLVRWRYIWDGVPGDWLGEGPVWQKPSPR